MAQLSVFSRRSGSTPGAVTPVPGSFAEADTRFAYLRSDQHHRHLAAAICKCLNDGRSFVLMTGDPQPSGELIADAINFSNDTTYRASPIQCHPDMDLGKLVRAYSAELQLAPNANGSNRVVLNGPAGLAAQPESAGIWTLISYLMAERQSGITRMLILKNADVLDLRCFDDLQRLAQLDEQHVMPVVLLCGGAADGGALAPFGFWQSPIVGRLAADHLEPREIGAFIQSQLEALGAAEEMEELFPPRIVEAITAASGGSAIVVNRLAGKMLVAGVGLVGRPRPPIAPNVAEMLFPEASSFEAADVDQLPALKVEPAAVDDAERGKLPARATSGSGIGWKITVAVTVVVVGSLVLTLFG